MHVQVKYISYSIKHLLRVIGLLTAMFYGSVAERLGEKLVLLLSLTGFVAMQLVDIVICKRVISYQIRAN